MSLLQVWFCFIIFTGSKPETNCGNEWHLFSSGSSNLLRLRSKRGCCGPEPKSFSEFTSLITIYLWLCISLSACLFIYLSLCLFLFVYFHFFFVYLSLYVCVCLFYLCFCLSSCFFSIYILSIPSTPSVSIYVRLYVCFYLCLWLCFYFCLSLSLFPPLMSDERWRRS